MKKPKKTNNALYKPGILTETIYLGWLTQKRDTFATLKVSHKQKQNQQ